MVKTILEFRLNGGSWLAAVRTWIQSNCRNGSEVRWGSLQILQMPTMTVNGMEDLAAEIGFAAAREEQVRNRGQYADLVTQAREALNELRTYSSGSHVHNHLGIVYRLDRTLRAITGQ